MIASRTSPALATVCVAALVALSAAGCGSKSSSTASSAASKATTSATSATQKYHAGEFCKTSKESVYRSLGFTCVNGRLKKM